MAKWSSSGETSWESFLLRCFSAGRVSTFVGAGGKSTGMRRVAEFLSRRGARVRLTTTTRLGSDELACFPRVVVHDAGALARALADDAPVLVISGGLIEGGAKLAGIDPALIERQDVPRDVALLVEGDGSRRKPVKAPRAHEPVIPSNSAAVFAVIGARGFDEPVDADTCYNPEGILALLGKRRAILDTAALVALAGHPLGCRKGVREGMGFHLVVNQGDLEAKRATARALVEQCRSVHGIPATLVSWQEEKVYAAAW